MDVLSDVLRAVRLTGAVFLDADANSSLVGKSPAAADVVAAAMPGVEHVISVHAVLSGSCRVLVDGSQSPLYLNPGDTVVFPAGNSHHMSSFAGAKVAANTLRQDGRVGRRPPFRARSSERPEGRTRIVSAYLGCDPRPFDPLLAALPPMFCTRRPDVGSGWATDLFCLAILEGAGAKAGSNAVLAKLGELIFVEVVRSYIENMPENSRGWLSGLRDPHVGEALRLMHARPAEDWNLDRLARDVGLSRSTFAGRFSQYVEESPMHYLARWRLQLAARRLEWPGTSLGEAAAEAGYRSEAAFNRAFKKQWGLPPGAWREECAISFGGRPGAG